MWGTVEGVGWLLNPVTYAGNGSVLLGCYAATSLSALPGHDCLATAPGQAELALCTGSGRCLPCGPMQRRAAVRGMRCP